MYDLHFLVDVGTLVCAVVGSFLASRRSLLSRLSKIEIDLAEIKGALKQAGFNIT